MTDVLYFKSDLSLPKPRFHAAILCTIIQGEHSYRSPKTINYKKKGKYFLYWAIAPQLWHHVYVLKHDAALCVCVWAEGKNTSGTCHTPCPPEPQGHPVILIVEESAQVKFVQKLWTTPPPHRLPSPESPEAELLAGQVQGFTPWINVWDQFPLFTPSACSVSSPLEVE